MKSFEQLCKEHPDVRRVAHIAADRGITLSFGATFVEWPSDWPTDGLDHRFFEERGFEMLREVQESA
ncbi:hypothetical protein R70006_06305 [Paraburkholderia domus]|uniref:hypothetical protein n=1 Tax=Paraburkholderia domus TaxID=2793075 RepID=UPI00191303AA|nr:hypothetical protein [Paraburkholderia domus]MBK5052933.1 hypothetical protein [Burkholderia sp. R-70006]CAE6823184.1 hypothetical protein R70006_06305 [Paraburkholderia domus]